MEIKSRFLFALLLYIHYYERWCELMLQQKTEDLITRIDTIQQTATDIENTITIHSFENVKRKILLILKKYPLTHFEYEELIKELKKISNNTPIIF